MHALHPTILHTPARTRTLHVPRHRVLSDHFTFDPVPSVPAHRYWAGHQQGERYNQALAQAAEALGIHTH